MDKEKIKIKKHDHRLTDLLKISIFSLVMMAPVTAIAVTCAYVVCNKNAYQSYSGNEITENTFIETYDDFILNETYYFNNGIASQTQYDYGGNGYNIYVDKLTNYKTQTDVLNVNFVSLYIATNGTISLTARDISGNFLLNISNNDMNNYNFVYNGISQALHTNFSTFFDLDIVYKIQRISPLDNVFYYAVDTMQNNSLFTWTKQTAIYTGIETMTTGLGITTASVPVLLTYWFLITVIYVIVDIVITMFTWITHLIGER